MKSNKASRWTKKKTSQEQTIFTAFTLSNRHSITVTVMYIRLLKIVGLLKFRKETYINKCESCRLIKKKTI